MASNLRIVWNFLKTSDKTEIFWAGMIWMDDWPPFNKYQPGNYGDAVL